MPNRKKAPFIMLAGLILTICLMSCSSVPGKERLAGRSGLQKDWVRSEIRSFKDDGMLYFRGYASRTADLSLGIRQAEADAKKRLIGKISESAESEYSEYMLSTQGASGKSAFAADGIALASRKVRYSGAEPVKTYWEKIEVARPSGVNYFYNVYTLLQIPEADYLEAKEATLSARGAEDGRAEESAVRLRDRLQNQLEKE